MIKRVCSLLVISISFVFSVEASPLLCHNFLQLLKERHLAQPTKIEVAPNIYAEAFNRDIAALLQNGYSPKLVSTVAQFLTTKGAFKIPVQENGVVAAAQNGDYSHKIWWRDLFRVSTGLKAANRRDDARKVILAGLNIGANDQQLYKIWMTLKHPHEHKLYREHQYRIFYELLPDVVANSKNLKAWKNPWSRQKDAYAFSILEPLLAIEEGLIRPSELDRSQKAFIIGMSALLTEVDFLNMDTADFWEEENARYTSGFILVIAALEKIHSLLTNHNSFLHEMLEETLKSDFDADALHIVGRVLRNSDHIRNEINRGYLVLKDRVWSGEEPRLGRKADTAFLMAAFMYRLQDFSEEDYRQILEIHFPADREDELVKTTGLLRYITPYKDPYLHPAYFLSDSIIPREMHLLDRDVTKNELQEAFERRNSGLLTHIFGDDFSARWSLGVFGAAQGYAKMAKWFPHSPYVEFYKSRARQFWMRGAALTTPGTDTQPLGVTLDGQDVPAFKFGEAVTPVQIEKGKAPYYAFSPYTPLNWATAEAILTFKAIYEMEFGESSGLSFD